MTGILRNRINQIVDIFEDRHKSRIEKIYEDGYDYAFVIKTFRSKSFDSPLYFNVRLSEKEIKENELIVSANKIYNRLIEKIKEEL